MIKSMMLAVAGLLATAIGFAADVAAQDGRYTVPVIRAPRELRVEIITAMISEGLDGAISGRSSAEWKPEVYEQYFRQRKMQMMDCTVTVRFSGLHGTLPLGNYRKATSDHRGNVISTGETVPMQHVPAEAGRHFNQMTFNTGPNGIAIIYVPEGAFSQASDPRIRAWIPGVKIYGAPNGTNDDYLVTTPNNPSRNAENTVLRAIRDNPNHNHSMYLIADRNACQRGRQS